MEPWLAVGNISDFVMGRSNWLNFRGLDLQMKGVSTGWKNADGVIGV